MVQLDDPALSEIYRTVAVPDGSGGAIAAWMDDRTEAFRVYAQRVDADGNLAWVPGGIAVSGDLSSSHMT